MLHYDFWMFLNALGMEAVYFGSGYGGGGKGPWVGADLENGIYGGDFVNDTGLHSAFVTAMIKGGTNVPMTSTSVCSTPPRSLSSTSVTVLLPRRMIHAAPLAPSC